MTTATMIAMLMLAPGPVLAGDRLDVAFEELATERNAEAIARIEGNLALEASDPARLINLGIAYARQGRIAEARALFDEAATSAERLNLETATGKWVDSRALARRALAALDRGEFAGPTRTAMR